MGPQSAVEVRAMAKMTTRIFSFYKWPAILLILISLPLLWVGIGFVFLILGVVGLTLGIKVLARYRAYGERYIQEQGWDNPQPEKVTAVAAAVAAAG